jgi:hypothetical protein
VERQFPNDEYYERVYDEYRPIRLSFLPTRIYSKFSDVNMVVPVYEFIDIKGLEFEKEDFIRIRSEFRANVIVLGSKIASSLLNSRTDRKKT